MDSSMWLVCPKFGHTSGNSGAPISGELPAGQQICCLVTKVNSEGEESGKIDGGGGSLTLSSLNSLESETVGSDLSSRVASDRVSLSRSP